MNPSVVPDGKTARAISDTTDGVPVVVGTAYVCTASQETPRNIAIAIAPSAVSVVAAFRPCGLRNALTPLAIASTPVSAVEPEANARSTTNAVTAPAPPTIGCGETACGHVPSAQRANPTPISAKIDATNAYVGIAKRIPASLTPRRFANAIRTTKKSDSVSSWPRSDDTAEVSASTPAATDTATVST